MNGNMEWNGMEWNGMEWDPEMEWNDLNNGTRGNIAETRTHHSSLKVRLSRALTNDFVAAIECQVSENIFLNMNSRRPENEHCL